MLAIAIPASSPSSNFKLRKASHFKSKSYSLISAAATNSIKDDPRPPLNLIASTSLHQNPIARRSENYKPTLWDFKYIQSIHNDYVGENHTKQFNELKKEMKERMMIEVEELEQLEMIDNLQRLGVSYHFKEEIKLILSNIHKNTGTSARASLYCTALKFRLLRQHGFNVSQDMLNGFMDENGNFKESICEDTEGLLQLYEASFLSTEDESALKNATTFTVRHLKNYVENDSGKDNNVMVTLVEHALDLPRHWMMLRSETEWYLRIYEKIPNANPVLLHLSKLDFNIVQAAHQEELRDLSRWWKSTCLAEKLSFSRDRLVEVFFFAVGMIFEPQQAYCRRMLTKIIAFTVFIDDIYDVYGSLDELELFTNAVERWDIKAMESLPEYMKICYLALFNSTNEMAYDILTEQGVNGLPYLTKQWADLCKAYLQEARWYYNGYTPSLQEYMDNASITIAIPLILVHAFFFVTNPITKEAMESMGNCPDLIRQCSVIIRLVDDLATSSEELKRGDVPKSIQCFMNEKGATEEEAREAIRLQIKEAWEQMNKDQRQDELLFSGIALNFTRTAHCVYQHGDGLGIQNSHISDRILKLLFEPMTIQ